MGGGAGAGGENKMRLERIKKKRKKWLNKDIDGLTEFDEDLKLRGEEELNLFLPPLRPSPPITPNNPPRREDGGLRSCSDF